MASVETVSVGAWVGVGARHEAPEVNGVSHVLEHMVFKGTRRRTARAIAEEIEGVGGHLNAYTSHENTAYYAKVLKDDIGLAADIIADIVQNAVMDPDELTRELAVIVQEIHHAHDTPDDIIFDHFQETAFPRPESGAAGAGLGREGPGHAPRDRHRPHAGPLFGRPIDRRRRRADRSRCPGGPRRTAFPLHGAPSAGGRREGALRRRRPSRIPRPGTGPHRPRIRGRAFRRRRFLRPIGLFHPVRRRHVVASVPGGAREPGPRLRDPLVPVELFGLRPVRDLRRHRQGRARRPRPRGLRRIRRGLRRGGRGRGGPRPRPTQGRHPDVAGKHVGQVRAPGPPVVGLWAARPPRRGGRQDRCRGHRRGDRRGQARQGEAGRSWRPWDRSRDWKASSASPSG